MARKIKFRAYDKERKKIKFFDLKEIYADCYHNVGFLKNAPHQHENDGWEQFELMQFTGLLDKNGKEVFENDIIVLSHPCWSVKCIVKYDNQLACYVLESFEKIDKGVRKSFLHIYQENLNYKVIGNLYQNPELLGGQDE